MRIARDVGQHKRLIEFTDSKFYARDFLSVDYKFLTSYDTDGNVIGEYAHIINSKNGNYYWAKPNDEIVSTGMMIDELVTACKEHDEILIDLYVDDSFKPNPTLKRKSIFGYKMSMSDATKKTWGGISKKSWDEQLYNLEPVDDIHSFHSLSQVIPEI